ncbi:N-acylneuraminate cytidylyltransferase/CMP-N,N'-diacetyllegionaminic acid synthase [Brevundimonas alba]|uniref:N-acylneuraminate cytidylyltransferase/CMP-N,N'-diacetyllegionaminic acid synthase n=1 Tax=Brevundimonas alba TaxID=74314 RepID=A0A7X5YMK5_9CAUL|nr:acylneuraminate cytidylyltransferase family protein [Brevundimonas alba]NJC41305.1 N-acylneuraminate cytidylyltransferase/CMP-N,N'-diacetyllegionaminic acid synthase [Brevundimonas alba]
MIDGRRVLAIVPARKGSKGLPLKNVRPLAGKPLLAWPIAAARASSHVDRVIISTDDQGFADIAVAHGAEAPFLRPAELASDTAPSIGFILHAVDTLAEAGDVYEYVVLLEPTSPLTEGADVDAALEQLIASGADAIVGVTALETNHPAYAVRMRSDGVIDPLQPGGFAAMPRRQDLEPVFGLDGSLYISTVEALRREQGFCHAGTLGYRTARHKAHEVDDLVDFLCIEAIAAHLDTIRQEESRTSPSGAR